MPRFFFDTADGDRDCDQEGVELAGDGEAVREAIRYAGSLLEDDPSMLRNSPCLHVTARTADDRVVAQVRVELTRTGS